MSWACDPALTNTIVDSYHAAGPQFVQALQTFLTAQCALVGDHLWPADAIDDVVKDPYFDFIVVGAGSAGSVVANRLSEVSQWKVLLVEAGGNPTIGTEMPHLFYNNMKTSQDWNYTTQPDGKACRSYKNQGCAWPRGKTLGGSSSINGMFYVRGNKADYDEWATEGNIGWSYENVLPYFKKSENIDTNYTENTKYHGTGGLLHVQSTKTKHVFEEMLINAYRELGLKVIDDYNGNSQMGVGTAFMTIKDGVRQSTARAFLNPIKDRKNLFVIKQSTVNKIVFETKSNVATGISINKDGKDIIIKAKKEIILSGGSINTPKLMMLSGLGPKEHLEDKDIEVKADLPVGQNLQDHCFVPSFFILPGDKKIFSLPNMITFFAEYILSHTGVLADMSPHKIVAFINTTDPKANTPDIQNHYLILPPNVGYNVIDLFNDHDLDNECINRFKKLNEDNVVIVAYTVLLKPKSKGVILLESNDPNADPLIYANYFDDIEDKKTMIRGIKQQIIKLNETKSLKEIGFKLEWLDIEACKKYEKGSDDFLECYVKHLTFSLYHPTSSVKMGPVEDETSVVTPDLKVKKVVGLRVADASVMPSVVRGNTNAPTIMIGEKVADMVKEEWLKRHTEL